VRAVKVNAVGVCQIMTAMNNGAAVKPQALPEDLVMIPCQRLLLQ
jgi:hypothetical protein